MATWIAGTEESTITAASGGLPGRGSSAAPPREPAGTWHAVNADTGSPACGTNRFLETWPDRPWATGAVSDRCADCVAAVPFEEE